jgi:diguanylate cyclase (GGDEF)-like protein
LPNRILLKDRIEHALENARRQESLVAVCCLDLDNFKKVNDTYGHSYGDDVLEQTALRIKSAIREADTLSRIGGDEFIVLLENLFDVGEVEKIVKKIQLALEEPFLTHEKQFFLSVSIGISQYPQHGNSSEMLIKNADIAMYKAKNAGKNTYRFYTSEMSSQTKEEVDTENALKVAIKEKQFIVYYQPQVNLKTKQIIGLEALVRWKHPLRGLLGPMQFIRLCEDTKMIIPIGEYVFKQACEDLINLKEETGFEGRVSINVSGIQIEHSDFLGFLEKTLAETSVSPSHLELEITESVIMKNPKNWIEILSSIRRLGVKIAIDDFGTGYSSLSYLRKLPIDKLKIDMSFVRDIPAEEDACAIAKSIINLSDSMKMVTLAEGIETEAQEAYLRENGCEEGQGYLYAKPMDIQSLKNFLQDYPIG